MLPQVGASFGNLENVVFTRVFSESSAVSAVVTNEINGEYSFVMEVPIGSKYWDRYRIGQTIVVKVDNVAAGGIDFGLQRFQITDISAGLEGLMQITAEHFSYQPMAMMVTPFRNAAISSLNPVEAYAKAWDNSYSKPTGITPVCYRSNIGTSGLNITATKPITFKDFVYNTLISAYGGELFWKGKQPHWCTRIKDDIWGTRPTARAIYGGNIIGMSISSQGSAIPHAIYPYWGEQKGTASDYQDLSNKLVYVPGATGYIEEAVSFDSQFKTIPTTSRLTDAANNYVAQTYGANTDTDDKSFTLRLADTGHQDPITLGDDIYIKATPFGVDGTYEIRKIKYDVLNERVIEIEAGVPADSFAKAVIDN